jgi:hypothetical protein
MPDLTFDLEEFMFETLVENVEGGEVEIFGRIETSLVL